MSFSDKRYLEYDKDFNLPKSLEFKGTIYSKTRSPIEEFVYKNTYVFLYRLPVVSKNPLTKILKIKIGKVHPMYNDDDYELIDHPYITGHNNYSIIYKVGKPVSGNAITFNLSGSDTKIIKETDTLYSYYTKLGSFSINYNNSDVFDFYGEQKRGGKSILLPILINFREKNGHYYVFFNIQKD